MKKIILAVIATSMLLTTAAFASTKTAHVNAGKNSAVSNIIHLNTQDPS